MVMLTLLGLYFSILVQINMDLLAFNIVVHKCKFIHTKCTGMHSYLHLVDMVFIESIAHPRATSFGFHAKNYYYPAGLPE
jgi:hypothetical protein